MAPIMSAHCKTRRIGNRQAAEAGHARRAVDQAQAIFGAELNRLQTFFRSRPLRGNELPAFSRHCADTQQRDADVGTCESGTRPNPGTVLAGVMPRLSSAQQCFDHLADECRICHGEVDDRRAHDRAGRSIG